MDEQTLRDRVIDAIGSIKDPEHPFTLEELEVVKEEDIVIKPLSESYNVIIYWAPTVPHCGFANNIGLSMSYWIKQYIPDVNLKVDLILKEDSHETKQDIDKQVNDKERIAAALENPDVIHMIEETMSNYN